MSKNIITSKFTLMLVVLMLLARLPSSIAQLRPDFYGDTCPNVKFIVRSVIQKIMLSDPTIPAAILRTHYHDCFVNGCDASILLDSSDTISSEKDAAATIFGRGYEVFDTIKTIVEASCPGVVSCTDIITIAAEASVSLGCDASLLLDDSDTISSEKNARTTKFGRGYDVVDKIKAITEAFCPGVVSCADIITMSAESSVSLSGGPSWNVMLGRRDGTTANLTKANEDIPSSLSNLDFLASKFFAKGLDLKDLVALTGAHSLGYAHCSTLIPRLYNKTLLERTKIKPSYLAKLQEICPRTGNVNPRIGLDRDSPLTFDNSFFQNLLTNEGLLNSDQTMFSTHGAVTVDIVKTYSLNQSIFFDDFIQSMIKMANISPLTGNQGEIRQNCRKVNDAN